MRSTDWPTIRQEVIRGKPFWLVDARKSGTNFKRERFTTKKEAKQRAQDIRGELEHFGKQAIALPLETRLMAAQCAEKLKPFGKTLHDATAFFVEHLTHEEARRNSATVEKLSRAWETAKKTGKKLRAKTLSDIRDTANLVRKLFADKRIMDVTEGDVQAYLDSLDASQRWKHNVRNRLGQFFNWCVSKRHLAANPCKSITVELDKTEPQALSVAECERLLKVVEEQFPDLACYHALCLFAGLRPSECKLLKWQSVHLQEREITVLQATSKVSETRTVPIEENLRDWLETYGEKRTGFVTRQPNLRKRLEKLRIALGYRLGGENVRGPYWVDDVLRHSYASYWLSKHRDRAHLAENMGNSARVIGKHYKQVVKQSDCIRFWDIVPAPVRLKREADKAAADAESKELAESMSNCGTAYRDENGEWQPITEVDDYEGSAFDQS